jgi:hypothetical protein
MVARGYSQVPGKDFSDSHAPVITVLAFKLVLIIKVVKTLRTGQYGIETHFSTQSLMKKST